MQAIPFPIGPVRVTSDHPERPHRTAGALPSRADHEQLQPRRILVVEDEVFVRLDIEQELERAGYEVVGSADSANEAILVAERERPDLVLMDVRLVGPRDGIDAALELWRRYQIRCLFVSANLDPVSRHRAAPAEPWGFLAKPFSPTELLAAIQRRH
jgi:DNA-binding NarL/FixJ family response regulator